ncbi:MAG TPA: alpha/beta fold hydrolase [Acidimicrobiales bacterium]|nr:alpha/beta fold hydrolase [Acidimicrobiales bacterium]
MDTAIVSDGLTLCGHLARPAASSGGPGLARHGLVICHGFPAGPGGAASTARSYPNLADRVAADTGWVVLTFNFRGTGESQGDFSLGGWLGDLRAAVDHLLTHTDVDRVWLAGFGAGGGLSLCAAGEDERVGGVAAFSAPADFDAWSADPRWFLQHGRSIGVVRNPKFPPDFSKWARELHDIRPISLVGKVPPRPVLLVHGADDDVVSHMDARALADATDGEAELRVLASAGSRLRHDPRAIAVLLGWLDRQT